MAEQAKTIFSWEAPEFKHYPKNMVWYACFVIAAGLLLTYEFLNGDYFGAVTIIILALITLALAKRKPNTIPITLSTTGVHINDLHIPYQHVRKFWLVEHKHHKTLNFETSAYLNRTVILELVDQDPEPIRVFLKEILEEHDDATPALTQHISHHLKI